jgi:hypothetical protein
MMARELGLAPAGVAYREKAKLGTEWRGLAVVSGDGERSLEEDCVAWVRGGCGYRRYIP